MSKLIFVTGASGFLAAHVIHQLLEQGYRVRATARGAKVAALKELYSAYPALEIVEVSDIVHSQFQDALVGVDAVIHTATPLPARVDSETLFGIAIEGSLNVLRQAEKAGVKKIVVTSSTAAIVGDPTVKGVSFTINHWNPAKKEDITPDTDPVEAYGAAKAFGERAVWEWAEAHPHVDVTTINPTYIYGPFAPVSLRVAPGDFTSLSTNLFLFNLITPPGQHLPGIGFIDVRDAARAHVGALTATGAPANSRKRAILASPHGLVESKLFELIRKERPQAGARLVGGEGVVSKFDRYDIDFAQVEQFTGMKKGDFHTTEQTFLGALDSILAVLENDWKERGYDVKEVPLMQC